MGVHIHVTITRREARGGGRWRRLMLAGAAITIAAAGGVAMASIPSAAGVFHGCANSASGALRLIDPAKNQNCTASETAVSWNQTGISWQGTWSSSTSYEMNDAVAYNGSSYLATSASTGATPGSSPLWALLAGAGINGNTVLNGAGAPAEGLGAIGDFYIDTSAHEIYGPKLKFCFGVGRKRKCGSIWETHGTAPRGTTALPVLPGRPGRATSITCMRRSTTWATSPIPA